MDHIYYMNLAILEANKAKEKNEIPIGALITSQDGNILSASHNQTISLCDPTAHAEILALREACRKISNYRLLNTILYVTIEPCIMCMGAILNARISKIVFGANEPKWGAVKSLYNMSNDNRLNHRIEVVSDIMNEECRTILKDFFKKKRRVVK